MKNFIGKKVEVKAAFAGLGGEADYECYQGYVRDISEDFMYMDLEHVLRGPLVKYEIHGKLAINKKYIITIFELND